MPKDLFQEHVELIAKHEQEFLDRRTARERFGDLIAGGAGSVTLVCVHLAALRFGLA
ncbi:hypothetical protein [Occallatibacter riparius]|uniref:Uncharacterized protein n=1 Tax=Occallatibacter riparius TaxID=1002689 RepID=A0A9J7BKR3_9BACT|nr:hypothetical protein [Occallatibacter riparius]UWZ81853.1 hypothetical protein MOP44_14815 [Occallatibacter riparius]